MSTQKNNTSATSQPSSILFFIAVAIGVVIALVFIFFSMRYYVRTRLGIYATARLTTTSNNGGIVLLTGDFPMHSFNGYSGDLPNQLRRRNRRRKYLKKRRLTEEEVDHLFPVRTYQDWLDGGAERDADQREIHVMLKEENDDEVVEQQQDEQTPEPQNQTQDGPTADGRTITATDTIATSDTPAIKVNTPDHDTGSTYHDALDQPEQVDLGTPYEPHYDSGTCAICIDTFEPEDPVRGLICGHVFHQECLDPWLTKRKACCPMCKRDYYLKDESDEQQAQANGTEQPENQIDDLDSINQFTELQYTTLNERVTEILNRHPDLEQIATEKIKKYLKFKWRVFWLIMGISKSDLVNSAIVNEDQRLRDEDPTYDVINANEVINNGNNDGNANEANNNDDNNEGNRDGAGVQTVENSQEIRDRVERMV